MLEIEKMEEKKFECLCHSPCFLLLFCVWCIATCSLCVFMGTKEGFENLSECSVCVVGFRS
jgi:hypothetical protein